MTTVCGDGRYRNDGRRWSSGRESKIETNISVLFRTNVSPQYQVMKSLVEIKIRTQKADKPNVSKMRNTIVALSPLGHNHYFSWASSPLCMNTCYSSAYSGFVSTTSSVSSSPWVVSIGTWECRLHRVALNCSKRHIYIKGAPPDFLHM